jgi:Meiotically Up-regulated Gene 113 (MUG113) protein
VSQLTAWFDGPARDYARRREIESLEAERRVRAQFVEALEIDTRRVYFIQCGDVAGPVKIGISGDVQQRLDGIQSHNPHVCRLLGTMAGGRLMEEALHRRFSHSRIRGEWFYPNPFVLKFVRDLRDWFVVT